MQTMKTKTPTPRKGSPAPQPRKPNPLLDKQSRWQRVARYVWDKKKG
jgi:hypothetical protein